jgi:hypothetical protein
MPYGKLHPGTGSRELTSSKRSSISAVNRDGRGSRGYDGVCRSKRPLIAVASLPELHHVHVPVAAQVGEQAGFVDAIRKDAAH